MATLAEIRVDILQRCKGQILSDDERLREDYIEKLIRDKRNFLVQEEGRRGLGHHQAYYQQVDCLQIQCGTVQCAGVDAGIRYHYVDLPKGVTGRISYFGTVDGRMPFVERSLSGFLHDPGQRFGGRHTLYTIVEERALLKDPPTGVDLVRLYAILDDPMEKFGDSCFLDAENSPYPVPVDRISRLQNLVLMDLLPTQNIQPDTTNDAADTTTPARVDVRPLGT